MRRMAQAKQKYDSIPIPGELSERVMQEVEKANIQRSGKKKRMRRIQRMRRAVVAAASAAAVLFMVGVNTSEVFAREMSDVPVLGAIARLVTIRSYDTETEDMNISVEIPGVEMISEELSGLEDKINEEIHGFCEQYAEGAVERAEEYKKAFLETGGTQEEWAEHHIAIKVWYEVKSYTDRYLSLAVAGSENWSNAYHETKYYNLDLREGKWVTLEDILGEDYARIAGKSILQQTEQREKETGLEFWIDQWDGVDESTKFYINDAGNPVIVFEKYEIAPGAAGEQEFEIVK